MMAISRSDFSTMVLSAVGFRCIRRGLCIAECERVPFILGLTGNIACGKSSVGALLAERFAADYLDADRVVHERYAAGTPETRTIAERFGSDLLTPEGTIDRRRLGVIVMADRAALRELE